MIHNDCILRTVKTNYTFLVFFYSVVSVFLKAWEVGFAQWESRPVLTVHLARQALKAQVSMGVSPRMILVTKSFHWRPK